MDQLDQVQSDIAALGELLRLYRFERTFPDLSNFRLGPNMFDKIPLDWIVLIDDSSGDASSHLVAHGIATRIRWNGAQADLPPGWQNVVRQSYMDSVASPATSNALVGLFINVEPEFREHGWASNVVQRMKTIQRERNLESLIIPLRLPQHYVRENAGLPISEFAAMRREDGQPVDYWLRLHTQLGAQILSTCDTSHQHAMNVRDFEEQFGRRFESTGYHLVEKNGEWFRAYVDVDREFVLVNQGCVWVRYPTVN